MQCTCYARTQSLHHNTASLASLFVFNKLPVQGQSPSGTPPISRGGEGGRSAGRAPAPRPSSPAARPAVRPPFPPFPYNARTQYVQEPEMDAKQTRYELRLPEPLKAAFLEVARSQDQDAAQLVRAFMRDYIKNHAQKPLPFLRETTKA